MNHWSNSPGVGGGFDGQQTNESPSFAARKKGTPQEGSSNSTSDCCKYLMSMSEDLDKLRRSSHHMRNSSHHLRNATTARRPTHSRNQFEDAMDDNEHDEIVKGLLYPGLEETDANGNNMDDSDEFGCDDFFEEDLAMAEAAVSSSSGGSSSTLSSSSISDLLNNTSPPMMSSYERSYFATMGRPYSDLTNEKLGR